jgi:serine protease inhibitor
MLTAMADESDDELQRMEGFTSSSDSDIDVLNLPFGQTGLCMF